MAVTYVVACLLVLIFNVTAIPSAIVTIVQSAFGMRAVAGGALGAVIMAMQKGIARGISPMKQVSVAHRSQRLQRRTTLLPRRA